MTPAGSRSALLVEEFVHDSASPRAIIGITTLSILILIFRVTFWCVNPPSTQPFQRATASLRLRLFRCSCPSLQSDTRRVKYIAAQNKSSTSECPLASTLATRFGGLNFGK